jgi:hypothetical protein
MEEGRLESIEVVSTDLRRDLSPSFENAYQLVILHVTLLLTHAPARETKLAAVNNANSVDGEPESLLFEGYRVIERLCDLAKRSSTRSFERMAAKSASAVQWWHHCK